MTSNADAAHRNISSTVLDNEQAQGNPLLIHSDVSVSTPITCTVTTTTTDEVVGNNSFPTAATLANYNNLSLLAISPAPPGPAPTLDDYFRLDNATPGFKYTVETIPNGIGNYNLGIIVYDKNFTPVLTDTNTLDGFSATVELFAVANANPYYFRVTQLSPACSGGTYRLLLSISRVNFKTYLPAVSKNYPPSPHARVAALSGTTAPEYVTIENFGDGGQLMSGWYLVSEIGAQTFYFPDGYSLSAGAAVRIESYTHAPGIPPAILLWTPLEIWDNSGDKAVLYNDSGAVISSMCYGNACPLRHTRIGVAPTESVGSSPNGLTGLDDNSEQ